VHSKIIITTVCENRAPSFGLAAEHGLSMLLEVGGQRILFDTGAGQTLAANAEALGIDLSSLNAVVLSHGHYDHTGGLKAVLEINSSLPVYAHPDVFNGKYSMREGETPRYIGPPWTQEELSEMGARFHLEQGPLRLDGGVLITGQIPRLEEAEKPESYFFRKTGKGFAEDSLKDDQALVVESSLGLIVLLGCAHSGLINTLRYITHLTGRDHIYALLGGTHLLNASVGRLAYTVESLRRFKIELLAPCHCTGPMATAVLRQAFGERFMDNHVGSIFKFDA
jgi:7,8-dihydropterin-6-yl-methyl-4-(beta-D-ribofuranosyl)aminobenzene 5'-phosphate synthase